jgi:hypothetical protein
MPRSPSAEVGAASTTQRAAAGGRSGIGRLIPRLPILGDLRLGRRLGWVIFLLIILVTAIVGYNARAIAQQRGSALIVNTAARQRALVERYTRDVLLVVDGFQADPKESAEAVRQPVNVLLDGGSVRAPQGDGSRVEIPPARNWRVRRKLEQDRRLIDELIHTGDRLLDGGRDNPRYAADLTRLRVLRSCRASPMTPPRRSPSRPRHPSAGWSGSRSPLGCSACSPPSPWGCCCGALALSRLPSSARW